MRWIRLSSFVIMAVIVTSTSVCSAGVLGKRYVGFDLARVSSDLSGDGTAYGAEVRLPTIGVVDLVGSFARTDLKFTSGSAVGVGFDLHGGETQWIGSYLSLASLISFPGGEDAELGFQYGGGVELRPNEMVSLAVGGACAKLDHEGEFMMTLGLYSWFADRVLGGLTLVRGFDPDDTTVGLGLAIGF
jgi:hypothetical protein